MILALAACGARGPRPGPPLVQVTGFAMGGELRVIVRCPSLDEREGCTGAAVAARDEVLRVERLATDWEPGGEISALNAAAGHDAVAISPEVEALLRVSLAVSEVTDGAFDPTIGALWGLWDFEQGVIPAPDALAARLPLVDWRVLQVEPGRAALPREGMAVTLGGVAQGYAAARALEKIPADYEALVDLSGDLAARGAWSVGVQDPRGARGEIVATVRLVDGCLSTAGDYERAFMRDGVRYHHILDPRTGLPTGGPWSVTVVHPDCAVGDALDTALMVTGLEGAPAALSALGGWALIVDGSGLHAVGDRSGLRWRRAR